MSIDHGDPGTHARRIVVTGAAGQLGSQIVALAGREKVVGLTSSDLDITDAGAVADVVEPGTVVINCAAYTAVDAAETDEATATTVNETGPAVLAAACAAAGASLVHVSTDYVFAGDADLPYEPTDPTGPKTAYGRTKLAGERAVHRALPSATIVRTAWVYTGAGSDFVSTMLRLERERDTIDVVDDQIGSPTYSRDLAAGLLELAGRREPMPPILNATNSGTASWFDLAAAVFAGVGADPSRVHRCSSAQFVRPAPRPAYSVLSARAWNEAGLIPLRSWQDALTAALAAR